MLPLIAAGLNLAGQIYANNQNRQAAESAQQFSAQQYATRYQTQVADMKAAGLNPMLAYQQSPGASAQGVSYQSQNPMANVASSYQAVQQGSTAPSQIGVNEASAAQSAANVRVADQTVDRIKAEIPQINSATANLNSQHEVIVKTARLIAEQIGLTSQQTDVARSQFMLNNTQMFQIHAILDKLKLETKLLSFDVDAANDLGNVGREATQLKPIFDIIRGILRK
jgi:hypothetical protein